jgi:hypothetical protein
MLLLWFQVRRRVAAGDSHCRARRTVHGELWCRKNSWWCLDRRFTLTQQISEFFLIRDSHGPDD